MFSHPRQDAEFQVSPARRLHLLPNAEREEKKLSREVGDEWGVAGHELLQLFLLVISCGFIVCGGDVCSMYIDRSSISHALLSFRNKDMYLHIIDLYKMLYINNGFCIIIVSIYIYIRCIHFLWAILNTQINIPYTYICHCIMFGSFPHHPLFLWCAWL